MNRLKGEKKLLEPCIVSVKVALPYIRAMVANELINMHHLSQIETAKLLEISQPAVSLYRQKMRGNSINVGDNSEIKYLVTEHANSLVNNSIDYHEKANFFCKVCGIIRSKGYLCPIHRTFDSMIDKECSFCKTESNICKL